MFPEADNELRTPNDVILGCAAVKIVPEILLAEIDPDTVAPVTLNDDNTPTLVILG